MAYADVGVSHISASASSEVARARIYPASFQFSHIKMHEEVQVVHRILPRPLRVLPEVTDRTLLTRVTKGMTSAKRR